MKRFAFLCLLGVLMYFPFENAHAQKNMFLFDQLAYDQGVNDIWGYVDARDNVEYAIVGLDRAVSIVSLANPAAIKEVARIPDAPSLWHDMKVWNHHIYVTNEGGQGLLIIDASNLPEVNYVRWNGSNDVNFPINMNTSHNIYIDEKGYAYIFGADVGVGGAIILDLNEDPLNPPIVGIYDRRYVHDGFVRDDVFYSAEINDGLLSIIDVSDKASPQILATTSTPSNFTHNCWLSDDDKYVFTTDERANAFLAAYDVSDLSDIREVGRIQSSPGQNVIPHNTFVVGDFLVTSYYRDGVTIHDITDPTIMVEVGNYDTSADFTGDGFNGCWGVYPYLPSGLVIASDMEEGLFVMQPSYIRACYLKGEVTDGATGATIEGVSVTIEEIGKKFVTDFSGAYANGIPDAGLYTVTFSKIGYESVSYSNIFLSNGETVNLSASLSAAQRFTLNGRVVNEATSKAIAEVNVVFTLDDFIVETMTDENGAFSLPDFLEGSYQVSAGKWGYETFLKSVSIDENNSGEEYALRAGYYDDFASDFGWTVESTASNGRWERGVPYGTSAGGGVAINPGMDVAGDAGNSCFVTGNLASSNVGADDVDAGYTRLISPIFDLSEYEDAQISYYRWFANAGGQGFPNDELVVTLSNGMESAIVEVVDSSDPFLFQWYQTQIRVSDFMEVTENMQITFETSDEDGIANGGNLVEAGIDVFSVVDLAAVDIDDFVAEDKLMVLAYPNPFKEGFNIQLNGLELEVLQQYDAKIRVFNIRGEEVLQQSIDQLQFYLPRNDLVAGFYLYVIEADNDWISRGELMVQD